ncbi:YigZ family protein [Lactococcus formosensis]|uniref:YigZ family protein n=1 Tax=Lactococcus formosensis TaxID=1281486 RepID=A0A9X4SG80_9LACT|nr:YigZ family protein [Lactococcus formosensis]MCO7180322.1 YigZ family protein [Lactococcus formosensis]MDG6111347.1 YigZ family protein [Lactococcus formosensis]MDG6113606.1 YigZ family protein [Lactococcus formosensis]MDG6115540.1 YigZ family protein [Lactococcus formosensis]MDG6117610.1 YigZ family protein [Lactococcus formosensis]
MIITIKEDFTAEEEIKKSRFICHLKRVYTEEEARSFISEIKKEHHKANHNCSAFTLGDRQEIQRSSDDGEPSGTAGVPMLEILKKREITNVCAVVTRYFGGIKLGAGGLIRAYAGSVGHALDQVGLVKFVTQEQLILTLDYGNYDGLQRFLSAQGLIISESEFLSDVTVKLFVDLDKSDQLLADLIEQFSGKISVAKGDKHLVEVDI